MLDSRRIQIALRALSLSWPALASASVLVGRSAAACLGGSCAVVALAVLDLAACSICVRNAQAGASLSSLFWFLGKWTLINF